jgi:hypothetical protein
MQDDLVEKIWPTRSGNNTCSFSLEKSYASPIGIISKCESSSEIAIDKILHDRRSVPPPDWEYENQFIGPGDFFLDFFSSFISSHFFLVFISEKVLLEICTIEIEYFDSISFFCREFFIFFYNFMRESL